MSKASNLAGFATAVSPPSNLTVGVITATTVSATTITGSLTGTASTATASATAFGLSGTPNITVGVITATGASISGNVTVSGNVGIAGTLTYEDVTNVDSVGLITARSGVNVTGGSVVVGSAVTLSSGGIRVGVVTATTGCIQGTITAGTATVPGTVTGGVVCATSCFSGSGSGLSNIPSSAITGSLGGIRVCTFSSPGTFSVPPGTTTLKITGVGGGGSGGPGSSLAQGSGGGAGAQGVKYLTVPPSCSSYPVTIGGAGGDTVFGGPTVFLLEGGCAGSSPSPPGVYDGGNQGNCGVAPATATHAIVSGYGYRWCSGDLVSAGSGVNSPGGSNPSGGNGQPSYFGVGGGANINFANGQGYGSGGRGQRPPAFPLPGTGAPGFIIVEW